MVAQTEEKITLFQRTQEINRGRLLFRFHHMREMSGR